MKVGEVNCFDKLREAFDRQGNKSYKWLTSFQKECWLKFKEKGFPTLKDEQWKYTSLSALKKEEFVFSLEAKESAKKDSSLRPISGLEDSYTVVFLDGVWRPEESSFFEDGLEVKSLAQAMAGNSSFFQEHFQISSKRDALSFLCHSFLQEGVFVQVKKGMQITKPLNILHRFTSEASRRRAGYFFHHVVQLEPGASLELNEIYEEESRSEDLFPSYFLGHETSLLLAENSQLKHSLLLADPKGAYHFGETRVQQKRESSLSSTAMITGGRITRQRVQVDLQEPGSRCSMDGLYLLNEGQHSDLIIDMNHRAPHCESRQFFKGLMSGASRGVFQGLVFVDPKATKTDAYQLNKNLLLGEKSRADSKPQLQIETDDVKCSHGSTTAQLREEEIFYLQSRCMTRSEAQKVLAHGYASEVILAHQEYSIYDYILQHLKDCLRSML